MGLVKVICPWRRINRSYTQNSIQWVLRSAWISRSISIYFVIVILFTNVPTFVMAEEHKELIAVLQGNGLFTRNAYQILAQEKNKNIFFSPISIHAVLSLAAQGSGGKTKKAFTDTLNVPDITTLAVGYKEAMNKLNSVEDVVLHIANKVYLKESYNLKEAFKQIVTTHFFSEVQPINFEEAVNAAKSINTWVENKTNNKIKDLISADDLGADTRLVLVNAIYFKGKWAEPFEVSATKDEKFYLNDNDTIDVKMMHIKKKFYYKNDETLDAKLLELPYTNKDLSMLIILPNKRNGIDELEAKLATTDLTKITEDMYRPEVIVALPKFKIEATINLNEPLEKLGLGEIFSNSADFSGMLESPEPLKVSKVIQKAFIEVNEEGAEAAAATAVHAIMKRAVQLPRREEFICDHQFLILLVDKHAIDKYKSIINILFKGKIVKPFYDNFNSARDEL